MLFASDVLKSPYSMSSSIDLPFSALDSWVAVSRFSAEAMSNVKWSFDSLRTLRKLEMTDLRRKDEWKTYRVFSMAILSSSADDWMAATSASSIIGPK